MLSASEAGKRNKIEICPFFVPRWPSHPNYGSIAQSIRKYSSEAASPKKSFLTPIFLTVGAAGIGVGVWRYTQQRGVNARASSEITKEADSVFKGGDQGWINLKLAHVDVLSHNTKLLRFEFPDKDQVSGLKIACTFPPHFIWK
jgi:cytochrome-b5 reductase